MLYYLSTFLTPHWGPFRLLQSHLLLLAGGTLCAALLSWLLLPHLWGKLPRDHGKTILKDMDGMKSAGKPTGAGFWVTLIALPVILLFAPLRFWDLAAIAAIYCAMLFGYLDDRAEKPWGQLRKGLLDAVVSLAVAFFIFEGHSTLHEGIRVMVVWLPFYTPSVYVSALFYVPIAGFLLWFTLNATNCSDGVDGLAGTLTIIALLMLAIILYLVVGYSPVARYLLIPNCPDAAHWAIVSTIVAGAFGGYLWYNAEPSVVLMGDAGSRFLGVLIATASLVTGNPLLIFALAPVILVNGGGGLGKLVFLRVAKKLGRDIGEDSPIRKLRFPLHDHCKKNLGWRNSQVLMRFTILQLVLMPLLLILIIKIR